MNPFETYKTYLAIRNHFLKDSYDYHKYSKKIKANLQSFYKRKDRFYFEKLSRQKSDQEIEEFFISNFVSCTDPETLWVGEIIKNGEGYYKGWQRKLQSLFYTFKEEVTPLFEQYTLPELFDCNKGHPLILKKFMANTISLETFVILDKVFLFTLDFDKKLKDPVWEFVSRRIKKYSPFLNIDKTKYKDALKELILVK